MRFGARTTLLPGLVLILVSLLLFSRAPVGGSYVVNVLPVMVLLGAAVGSAFPALMKLAMSGATREDAGLASGLVNTTVQVGAALGLAVLATLAATRTGNLRGSGESAQEALVGGYHLAFVIGAGLVLAALIVALTVLQSDERAEPAAEPAGEHAREPAYSEA
jgi:MFS family permease